MTKQMNPQISRKDVFNISKKEAVRIQELSNPDKLFGIDPTIFETILKTYNLKVSIENIESIDSIRRDFYGGRGEKTVVRVNYIENYTSRTKDFFIKRHCEKNPNEALHFKYLSKFNAPIPQMYAYYSYENENDIIINEVVKPTYVIDDPVFMLNANIFEPFIKVTAEFNSVSIDDEYKKILIKSFDIFDGIIKPYKNTIITMFEEIRINPVYLNLKHKISNKMEDKLLKVHSVMCKCIHSMGKGLYHWDHKPRNMGWSNEQQKHVLFDLEDTLWAPRFFNIGMWLGGHDTVESKYAPRETLAKMYLDIYNERKYSNISVDELLHECFFLWVAYKFEDLSYNFHECGQNPYERRDKNPDVYRKDMESKVLYTLDLLTNVNFNSF